MSAIGSPERRRTPDGRREVLIGGKWLDEERDDVVAAYAEAEGKARHEAAVARVAPAPKPTGKAPTERQREVWEAVEKHGTQGAAAKALGTTQGSIQSALKGYMRAMGIEGPLPGLLSKGKGQAKAAKPSRSQHGESSERAIPTSDVRQGPPTPAKAKLNGSTPAEARPATVEAGERIVPATDSPHTAPERAPKNWRDDAQVDGVLVISVDVTVPASEMATWDPDRIRALLSGVAMVEAALGERRP